MKENVNCAVKIGEDTIELLSRETNNFAVVTYAQY